MQVYEICTWLGSLDPDNINSIKTLIKDTIHIFMSSHGQTGLPVNNMWHQRENIAFAWSLCCLSLPLPLIEAAEKKDINKKEKERGAEVKGRGVLLPVAWQHLSREISVHVNVGVWKHLYSVVLEQVGSLFVCVHGGHFECWRTESAGKAGASHQGSAAVPRH